MYYTERLKFIYSGLLFALFLAIEPLRPEILNLLASFHLPSWPIFATIRWTLLVASVAVFYFGLPLSAPREQRPVPKPTHGSDPLLSLRAFACLLVIAGHGLAVIFPPTQMPERLNQGSSIWLLMGSPWVGVWIFFVLSGYLMGKGFYSGRYAGDRESVRQFYTNRLLRILPMYYAVLLLVSILTVPQIYSVRNSWEIVALALFSQHSQAPTPVVGALWSIQTEIAFYAMVPFLFLILNGAARFVNVWLLIALIAMAGFLYRGSVLLETEFAGWIPRALVPLVANLDLFLVGILGNWIVPSLKRLPEKVDALAIGLALLFVTYLVSAYFFVQASYGPHAGGFFRYTTTLGPSFATAIALACILLFEAHSASGRPGGAISSRVVRWTQTFGVLSYAIYVWHEPIMLRLRSVAGADLTSAQAVLACGLALGLTAVVSFCAFRLVEEPFENWKIVRQPAFPGP